MRVRLSASSAPRFGGQLFDYWVEIALVAFTLGLLIFTVFQLSVRARPLAAGMANQTHLQTQALQNLKKLRTGTPFSIDTLSFAKVALLLTHYDRSRQIVRVPEGVAIAITGWAVDARAKLPAGGVIVIVDNRVALEAAYGNQRADVATALGGRQYLLSGFTAILDRATLLPGPHEIFFEILTSDRRSVYSVPVSIRLRIVSHTKLKGR